jgi:hypothetical protein
VPLNLNIGLLHSTQAGSGVLQLGARSIMHRLIIENSVYCCSDQLASPDAKRGVPRWCWCWWCCCCCVCSRCALEHVSSAESITFINFSISSIKGRGSSIFGKVHKGLECVSRLVGLWGAELARFWWHFTGWGKPKRMKTLISRQRSTKST